MGYGGTVEDAGKVNGRPNDGGLDLLHIQAKRWSSVVGNPLVREFAGSLDGVRAKKGVLITTAHFSDEATRFVERIEKRIVLIDGHQLAELMIDHTSSRIPARNQFPKIPHFRKFKKSSARIGVHRRPKMNSPKFHTFSFRIRLTDLAAR